MARSVKNKEEDGLPEADRFGRYPHPRQTGSVFGHEPARQAFAQAIAGGHCHHAWLIAGREGIGKATLAYAVARYALSNAAERSPDGQLSIASDTTADRQIRVLSHPNLLLIRRPYDLQSKRLKTVVTVDEVRKLRTFLSHKGRENDWRVVVVDPVDELNVSAANALLKSLEEPPPNTLFLLITAALGRLLPTIRSRCRVLQLEPLSPDDLIAAANLAIQNAQPPAAALEDKATPALVEEAGGSVRRFLMLHEAGDVARGGQLRAIFEKLPDVDWPKAHALADRISAVAYGDEFGLFFDRLLEDMHRAALAAAGQDAPPHLTALGQRLVQRGRVASWAELWESIAAERTAAVALNLDRKALVLNVLERLAAVVRGAPKS